MKLHIKLTDLGKKPCSPYKDLPKEFDAIEEIKKRGNSVSDVIELIAYCKLAQTNKMIEYLKTLNPSAYDVKRLIDNCEFARNYYEDDKNGITH